MVSADGYEYEDATALTGWARRLVYAFLVIASLAVLSGVLEYNVLTGMRDGAFETEEEALAAAESSDLRQAMVALLQFVIMIAAGFVTLRWIHRANSNARALGAARLTFTPGWSVGWYFIPVMNLWKPYQAMKELWQASAEPKEWQLQTVPGLLGGWWFWWVSSSLLGNAAFRAQLRADELDELITSNIITVVSDVISIPLCITFVIVVQRIQNMQTRHRAIGSDDPMADDPMTR